MPYSCPPIYLSTVSISFSSSNSVYSSILVNFLQFFSSCLSIINQIAASSLWIRVVVYEHSIYIYAFSRCFYPKRLTVHSCYTYFQYMCQYMCSLGIEPTTFALLTQCSNHWATGTLQLLGVFINYNPNSGNVGTCFKWKIKDFQITWANILFTIEDRKHKCLNWDSAGRTWTWTAFAWRPREKTEECKDHRFHRAGTLPQDISIAFYLSSFLLLVSLLF